MIEWLNDTPSPLRDVGIQHLLPPFLPLHFRKSVRVFAWLEQWAASLYVGWRQMLQLINNGWLPWLKSLSWIPVPESKGLFTQRMRTLSSVKTELAATFIEKCVVCQTCVTLDFLLLSVEPQFSTPLITGNFLHAWLIIIGFSASENPALWGLRVLMLEVASANPLRGKR